MLLILLCKVKHNLSSFVLEHIITRNSCRSSLNFITKPHRLTNIQYMVSSQANG